MKFEPKGDSTEVTPRHSGAPEDKLGHKHKDGWTYILSTTAGLFEGSPWELSLNTVAV